MVLLWFSGGRDYNRRRTKSPAATDSAGSSRFDARNGPAASVDPPTERIASAATPNVAPALPVATAPRPSLPMLAAPISELLNDPAALLFTVSALITAAGLVKSSAESGRALPATPANTELSAIDPTVSPAIACSA